jgi:hypothetical protein
MAATYSLFFRFLLRGVNNFFSFVRLSAVAITS